MRIGIMLRLAVINALALAGTAVAEPLPAQLADEADIVGSPDGHFVITPSNPDAATDPAAFELNEPLTTIGADPGLRMTMPVEIGGLGPYPFIIDTGSQRTIIATELAERLALPPLPPVEIISMAGRVTVSSVRLDALSFGEHAIDSLAALTIARADMGSLGIIGLDSLEDKRLTLDFGKRRMEIGKSRRPSEVRQDDDAIVVRARSKFGQLILMNSRVDGRRVNVILDTGAEISVGNMALFRSLKVKRLVVPPTPTMLTSVTGIAIPAQFAVVRRLTIGAATMENVPMVFVDAAPFEELGLGDKPAMLLGMKMLRLFDRIAIDFGHRHIDFHLASAAGAQSQRLRLADSAAPGAAPR